MTTFTGTAGTDILPGVLGTLAALGDDHFFGLGGDDLLVGYTGDDTFEGGAGADLMIGGILDIGLLGAEITLSGENTADYASSSAGVVVDLAEEACVVEVALTVGEVEQAIITQFGKPIGEPVTTAGLKLKLPFIQEINPIDKRVLEWDGRPSDMPTKDKLYISVDLFARWRITDPLQYFLRLRDERSAQSRLDDILGSETRNAVAKHELIEIIRTTKDRVPLRDTLLTDAEKKTEYGDTCADSQRT